MAERGSFSDSIGHLVSMSTEMVSRASHRIENYTMLRPEVTLK